jgi:hypothetical protein
VATNNATSAAESTLAVRTLEICWTLLADFLVRTENVGDVEIHLAVGALVDQLSVVLIRLYNDLARGALAQSDWISCELHRHSFTWVWGSRSPSGA